MKDKEKLIQQILLLELEMPVWVSEEVLQQELSEWFDEDIESIRREDFFILYNQYIEDLVLYLNDYGIKDLQDRLKNTQKYVKKLKEENGKSNKTTF